MSIRDNLTRLCLAASGKRLRKTPLGARKTAANAYMSDNDRDVDRSVDRSVARNVARNVERNVERGPMTSQPPLFHFDNTYARDLPGFYADWQGADVPEPQMVLFNHDLADELGLEGAALDTPRGAAIFAGAQSPEGAAPLSQVYAGHQFGGFSPQLGDGRALLIGEIVDPHGARHDIQLKGSGRTPFSRGGDGKAVIGPVLREYIIGEAMFALGIPTTRALAAVTTGERIVRDGEKPGAVLTRVASSHIRVGTFQFFAARGETDKVRQLAEYVITRHDPDLAGGEDRYLHLFRRIVARQAQLVAKWMLVGFVHGVMNTDNTTISGETIDYGPCAFLDAYDPDAVFSSIDHGGRYAYGRQPSILQWNLARLAEALLSVIEPDDLEKAASLATQELNRFAELYKEAWHTGMAAKLGLTQTGSGDEAFFQALLSEMNASAADYTRTFRLLGDVATGADQPFLDLFKTSGDMAPWLQSWKERLALEPRSPAEIREGMNLVNPLYIPRNHLVEEALGAADHADYEPTRELVEVLKQPFDRQAARERFEAPAPESFGPYQTFCGT